MSISAAFFNDGFWFRINGKGLSVSWNRPMLFSERNGFEKAIKIGKLKVKFLHTN